MPIPEPGPDEVVVKVAATGIEASDIIQMAGGCAFVLLLRFCCRSSVSLTEPVGLGTDGALAGNIPNAEYDSSVQLSDMGCEGVGVVSAVGEGVTGLAVGQALAFMGYGLSFREYSR